MIECRGCTLKCGRVDACHSALDVCSSHGGASAPQIAACKGTLQSNGIQFDSSYDRGRPFSFKLGAGQVIAGWDQGLLDMCPGEARKLTIPPSLGYGSYGQGSIPGGSTLSMWCED